MQSDFSSYEAYLERYRMFYSEEDDQRPPILDRKSFQENFRLLKESYKAYQDLIKMGKMEEASQYYATVINGLENRLAIADASDNFQIRIL